ncbi:transcription elongation regulator 1-like protein isoform X1 [Esox lucius]|uniref:Transcription elongation regulator 1-like protein n=1 Tax=Esox lucius TaxID=8010 RepID=A0A3P8YCJ9_ESOLU|nr:transcription elongation regulator 1-like protein isoform X1 [Esox lucius]
MIPVGRLKTQPQLWQIERDHHPWVWMLPSPAPAPPSGLCRMGAVAPTAAPHHHPPFFLAPHRHHPPPMFQTVSSWQLSCDPYLPLRIPAHTAANPGMSQFSPQNIQWELPSLHHVVGFQPSANVELVPVFPHVYRSLLPPHLGKGWVEKRVPDYKVYLNNTLALDTAWLTPEEIGVFQRQEKTLLMTNQMAMSISRPAAASRSLRTLLVSPRRLSGCPVAIKRVGSNKRIALAAAAMMAMESDPAGLQGPSPSSSSSSSAPFIHPLHLFQLSPIKIPFHLTPPGPGSRASWENLLGPLLPAQLARMTSLSGPGVALMTGDWRPHSTSDKRLARRKMSCSTALVLHTEQKTTNEAHTEQEMVKASVEENVGPKDKRPVASTPVPGSPWCVVWTGDDRVFFFNPTMQLSVWEQPVDLKDRGEDLNRIIEDPPHKRKKDSFSTEDGSSSPSADDDDDEEHSSKTKRNKLEEPADGSQDLTEMSGSETCNAPLHRAVLPFELRVSHFRDMLLERGVSAFSTWEKELHKIVFDPRYLLLNSAEERKQVFDQFVKARMNEEYKEKKSKLLQAKEEYRKLLEESKITSRSTFKEFSERYGRDQRFKQVPKKKDQEHFFNQFINALKKRDKENRMRLRKMR